MLPDMHNSISYFSSQKLANGGSGKILHAFTCKVGAPLDPLKTLVERVRRAWGVSEIITVKQIHSSEVLIVRNEKVSTENYRKVEADAIITNMRNVALAVKTADCLPILLAGENKAIASVHGGWRGIIGGIIEKTILKLKVEMSVEPRKIYCAIGPHIGSCCYEVGDDVAELFEKRFGKNITKNNNTGKKMLDLSASVRIALINAGVKASNIDILPICTKCNPQWFYSFRRDGMPCGRQLSFIAFRE